MGGKQAARRRTGPSAATTTTAREQEKSWGEDGKCAAGPTELSVRRRATRDASGTGARPGANEQHGVRLLSWHRSEERIAWCGTRRSTGGGHGARSVGVSR